MRRAVHERLAFRLCGPRPVPVRASERPYGGRRGHGIRDKLGGRVVLYFSGASARLRRLLGVCRKRFRLLRYAVDEVAESAAGRSEARGLLPYLPCRRRAAARGPSGEEVLERGRPERFILPARRRSEPVFRGSSAKSLFCKAEGWRRACLLFFSIRRMLLLTFRIEHKRFHRQQILERSHGAIFHKRSRNGAGCRAVIRSRRGSVFVCEA